MLSIWMFLGAILAVCKIGWDRPMAKSTKNLSSQNREHHLINTKQKKFLTYFFIEVFCFIGLIIVALFFLNMTAVQKIYNVVI